MLEEPLDALLTPGQSPDGVLVKAMPSAGILPFAQTFICTFNNTCHRSVVYGNDVNAHYDDNHDHDDDDDDSTSGRLDVV